MNIKFILSAAIAIAVCFSSCTQEEKFSMHQDELIPEVNQTEIDLTAYADLEESVQAIIRSLDLSMRGLPANVYELTISPTGAISPTGEPRLAIATGSFTTALLVKAQDLSTGQDLSNGTIIGTGLMGFSTLSIPAYDAPANYPARVIGFFYWGNTNQWELFHFEVQSPNGQSPGVEVFTLTADQYKSPYKADGTVYDFTVSTNDSWTASLLPGGEDWVKLLLTTSSTTNSFVFFLSEINSNPSSPTNPPTIRFTGVNLPGYVDIPLTFIEGTPPAPAEETSNCYMVKPNSKIRIPVSRANEGIAGSISSTATIAPQFIWTDNPKGMCSNSTVKSINTSGTGSGGYLVVETGPDEGNAVVAVTVDGVIKWSWHIWVTNYDPANGGTYRDAASYEFMDRDLGALTNTRGANTSYGLFYQWGRKDPFPARNGLDEVKAMYSQTGAVVNLIRDQIVSTTNNLANSVANPTIFYLSPSDNAGDWFTTNVNYRNDELWNNNQKTAYDPCPVGWKVRKPSVISATYYKNQGWVSNGIFYPCSGQIGGRRGNMTYINFGGAYYWDGAPGSGSSYYYAKAFAMKDKDWLISYDIARFVGHSVRCTKE